MKKRVILLLLLGLFLIMSCSKPLPEKTLEQIPQIQDEKSAVITDGSVIIEESVPLKDVVLATPAVPKQEQNHIGDLIVSEGTKTIENTILTIKGNIFVNGTGTLIVKNSELIFDQEFSQQYRFYVQQNASLLFENVELDTKGKWFNFHYDGSPQVTFINVHGNDCCLPWHGSSENTRFTIEDSTVGLTLSQNVKIKADNSSLFFELVLTNVSGTFELPQEYREKYDLVIPNQNGIMEIHVTNSTFTDWGSTLDRDTNITFVNSKMTIGINAGSDWQKPAPHVTVRDLKSETYLDYKLEFDTNHLHLVNTYVRDWYPQAFNHAVVEIDDSDLADLQFSSGDATIIVRNSVSSLAIARQNVTYKIYNSEITGDVVAHDDAEIYLYDTDVEGVIKEEGNGKVVVDGKRIGK